MITLSDITSRSGPDQEAGSRESRSPPWPRFRVPEKVDLSPAGWKHEDVSGVRAACRKL